MIDYMQQQEPGSFEKSLKNLLLLQARARLSAPGLFAKLADERASLGQALHARLQGFPTSGMALNTFTLPGAWHSAPCNAMPAATADCLGFYT